MANRPNFLWLLLDDVSPTLPMYGQGAVETPNFNRIADEGCVYENVFATSSVCPTARNSIITGRYHTSNGALHARTSLGDYPAPTGVVPYAACPPPHVKAFPELLRAAGYFCTNNSKTDYQLGDPSSIWDLCGSTAHWDKRRPNQPFFAVFNPITTNESHLWPENTLGDLPADAHLSLPPFLPDTPRVRRTFLAQLQHIQSADAVLGKLISELEWEGLLENTFIVVTADHGMGFPRYKRTLYDTGLKIPLLIRAPGILSPKSRKTQLLSAIDLAPTMLSLAGVEIPRFIQGEAFLGEQVSSFRKKVFAAQDRIDEVYDSVRAVRDERFKYIANTHPELGTMSASALANNHPVAREIRKLESRNALAGPQKAFTKKRKPLEELYDLEEDPWELNNLAYHPDYRDTVRRMRTELDVWQKEYDPWRDVPEAEMLSQWWFEGDEPQTAAPYAKILGYEAAGVHPIGPESDWEGPVALIFECPTQGASIEYQITPQTGAHRWRLYTGKVPLGAGQFIVKARSVRYGYLPSPEVSWKLRIDNPFVV